MRAQVAKKGARKTIEDRRHTTGPRRKRVEKAKNREGERRATDSDHSREETFTLCFFVQPG